MKIPALPACHLSYCSNIHPGESWDQCQASLKRFLPEVKKRVCANAAFGVGLRLSAKAAATLVENVDELNAFCQWLLEEQLYVFTLNGFPYGTFHGEVIKENVYLPHWADTERLAYTCNLANIMAVCLKAQEKLGKNVENRRGSISTVPVGFKPLFQEEQKRQAALKNLMTWVAFSYNLEQDSGKWIQLALEPEPSCFLEDCSGTLAFFKDYLYSEQAMHYLLEQGLPTQHCNAETVQRYLGVCLDTCHAAVMFENAREFAEQLHEANISIPKLQITTALQIGAINEEKLAALEPFAENQYLHQSTLQIPGVMKNQETKIFFLDLPEAIQQARQSETDAVLRCHFHVPVFMQNLGLVESTQQELIQFLAAQKDAVYSTHLEVETYTFDVLPADKRAASVEEAIAGELRWVQERLR